MIRKTKSFNDLDNLKILKRFILKYILCITIFVYI